MPIYQRPTDNIGVTKTFSGTITDSGSTPIEGAVVALKRKGGGIVAFADTDASGNYSFNIDADGDFQIVYSLSKDPSTLTISDELSPANPYSWYSGGGYVLYSQQNSIVRLGTSNLYYPNGGGTVWTSMPSYRVIDTAGYTPTDPFSGGVVIGSYTETGIGEGAEVELGFANAGDYVLTLNGNPREYTAEEKNFGSIINKVTVKSIGRAYQTPILWVSGTSINHRIKSGDPLEGEYAKTVNGQEYWAKESSTTIAYGLTTLDIASYVSAYPSDYASRIREYYLNSINGYGEGYTYGAWPGLNFAGTAYVQGHRFTAALPGEQDKSNFDTTAHSIDDVLNPLCDEATNRIGGSALYYRMIYGPGGTDESPKRGGALLSDGKLSGAEVDLLKGWFGQHHWIKDLAQTGGPDITRYSDVITFAYQFIDGVVKTAKALANGLNNFTISSNTPLHMQAYAAVNPITWTIYNKIGAELQQARRQVDGTLIPENQYAKVIYPLLKKADIGVKSNTEGGNGLSDLEFTTTGPNNETITYRITPTEIVRTVTY